MQVNIKISVTPRLLQMFPPPMVQKLCGAVHVAVMRSFQTHPSRGEVTSSTVQDRVNKAMEIAIRLRGDHTWGIQRITDFLPLYLKDTLNGVEWKPDTRSVWMPSDGQL